LTKLYFSMSILFLFTHILRLCFCAKALFTWCVKKIIFLSFSIYSLKYSTLARKIFFLKIVTHKLFWNCHWKEVKCKHWLSNPWNYYMRANYLFSIKFISVHRETLTESDQKTNKTRAAFISPESAVCDK
jgi:hypothetical protein